MGELVFGYLQHHWHWETSANNPTHRFRARVACAGRQPDGRAGVRLPAAPWALGDFCKYPDTQVQG